MTVFLINSLLLQLFPNLGNFNDLFPKSSGNSLYTLCCIFLGYAVAPVQRNRLKPSRTNFLAVLQVFILSPNQGPGISNVPEATQTGLLFAQKY